MEICDVNQFYGHGHIIKKYCGYPENEPIPMAIQHGYNRFYKLKHDHFEEPLFDYWVYTPRVKENAIKAYNISPDSIHILGSPFVYLVDQIQYQPLDFHQRKGTIVFPSHSIPANEIVGTYDYYAEQLKLLPVEFHPITVCLHFHDINLGHHEAFYKRGFSVVTCGNFSPLQNNYLHNFINLCQSHQFIISNSLGSACIYGMYLELKFFIYGDEPQYQPKTEEEAKDFTKVEIEEYNNLRLSFQSENLDFEKLVNSNYQQEFAAEELGAKYKLSKPELFDYLFNLRKKRPYIDKTKHFWGYYCQSIFEDLAHNLKLNQINVMIFPDWLTNDEEELAREIMEIMTTICQHPEGEKMTLLIDIHSITTEDANLFLQGIAMNLMMELELDITEKLTISLVKDLNQEQWEILIANLNFYLHLDHENQTIMEAVSIEEIPNYSLEEIKNSLFLQKKI